HQDRHRPFRFFLKRKDFCILVSPLLLLLLLHRHFLPAACCPSCPALKGKKKEGRKWDISLSLGKRGRVSKSFTVALFSPTAGVFSSLLAATLQ
ncbi:unnamed protein product, partial [Pylaiella littoralis]